MRQAAQKLRTFWDLIFDGAPVEITGLSARRCLRLAGRVLLAMVLTLGRPCGVWNPGGLCLLAASGSGAEGWPPWRASGPAPSARGALPVGWSLRRRPS